MKKILFLLTTAIAVNLFAYSECTRTPNNVWLNLKDTKQIWICFEKGGCTYKNNTDTTTIDRMYSFALSAITANKRLTVKYQEDNIDCNNLATHVGTPIGIWFHKN